MTPVQKLLQEIGIEVTAQATTRQAIIKKLLEIGAVQVQQQKGQIASIQSHSSITIFSEELTVFLGFENRDMISVLCDWYECKDPWTNATVGRGEEVVRNIWVNMLGATTPGFLQGSMPSEAVSGGLTGRIVFVYAERKGKTVPLPFLSKEQQLLREALKKDLEIISHMSGQFKPTPEYLEVWKHWYEEDEKNPPFSHPKLDPYCGRRSVQLRKVSLICYASRNKGLQDSEGAFLLEEQDIRKAIEYLQDVEKVMPHVYTGVGANPLAPIQTALMAMVRSKGTVSMQEIVRAFASEASINDISTMLATLEAAGYLRIDKTGKCIHHIGGKNDRN